MWIATQERIQVLNAAKVRTDGDILQGTLVLIGSIGNIPGTIILLPFDLAGWRCHFDIHVRPAEFLNEIIHLLPSRVDSTYQGVSTFDHELVPTFSMILVVLMSHTSAGWNKVWQLMHLPFHGWVTDLDSTGGRLSIVELLEIKIVESTRVDSTLEMAPHLGHLAMAVL